MTKQLNKLVVYVGVPLQSWDIFCVNGLLLHLHVFSVFYTFLEKVTVEFAKKAFAPIITLLKH